MLYVTRNSLGKKASRTDEINKAGFSHILFYFIFFFRLRAGAQTRALNRKTEKERGGDREKKGNGESEKNKVKLESARKMSSTATKRRKRAFVTPETKRGIKHRRACVRCKHIIEGIKRN